jgi:hypothetical protein
MLHAGNPYCIDYAIRNLPSAAPIVEIGSFCGLSTNVIAHYKRVHGKANPLFTADCWRFEGAGAADGHLGGSPVRHADYREFVKGTFVRNVRFFSGDDLPHTVELRSDEFFAAWRGRRVVADVFGRPARLGGPISFCYIDGDHTYEAARRDFEHCDEFLEPGGFVFFDDSAAGEPFGAVRAAAEVQRLARYRLVATNPHTLFQKR